jgi:hypothetical protein
MIKYERMRWTGYVARTGEKRNVYSVLVEKSEGNRPVGERIILRWGGVVWIDLAEDREQ